MKNVNCKIKLIKKFKIELTDVNYFTKITELALKFEFTYCIFLSI